MEQPSPDQGFALPSNLSQEKHLEILHQQKLLQERQMQQFAQMEHMAQMQRAQSGGPDMDSVMQPRGSPVGGKPRKEKASRRKPREGAAKAGAAKSSGRGQGQSNAFSIQQLVGDPAGKHERLPSRQKPLKVDKNAVVRDHVAEPITMGEAQLQKIVTTVPPRKSASASPKAKKVHGVSETPVETDSGLAAKGLCASLPIVPSACTLAEIFSHKLIQVKNENYVEPAEEADVMSQGVREGKKATKKQVSVHTISDSDSESDSEWRKALAEDGEDSSMDEEDEVSSDEDDSEESSDDEVHLVGKKEEVKEEVEDMEKGLDEAKEEAKDGDALPCDLTMPILTLESELDLGETMEEKPLESIEAKALEEVPVKSEESSEKPLDDDWSLDLDEDRMVSSDDEDEDDDDDDEEDDLEEQLDEVKKGGQRKGMCRATF